MTPVKKPPQSAASAPARPFLKWAGGKAQLLEQFEACFPKELKDGSLTTYVEPFVGAGAVFFHVAQRYPITRAYLYDINEELVLTYKVVKSKAAALVARLEELSEEYFSRDQASREKLFYEVRASYNHAKASMVYTGRVTDSWVARAAQLIFLNKTCYNGLYRTNSRGEYNAPFGRYRNPRICDSVNLQKVSAVLRSSKATIRKADFEKCLPQLDAHTFVYFDPPYRPLTRTASFTNYSRDSFNDGEQIRLGKFFDKLSAKTGARAMLSNSDPTNADPADRFFDELYKDHTITRVRASRMINSKATKRGRIRELVVRNY